MARNNTYKEHDYHSVQKLFICVSQRNVFLCNLEHCIIFPELNTISYVIYFLFSDRIS